MEKYGEHLFIEDSEDLFNNMRIFIEDLENKIKDSIKDKKQISPFEYSIRNYPMTKMVMIQVWCYVRNKEGIKQ